MARNRSAFADNFDELVAQFNYDRSKPLEVKTMGEERKVGASVQDASYSGSGDERLQAYRVVPFGEGPFPGVVFVHPAPGDRTTFMEEAVLLGEQGLASLVVEAPWAQGEVFGPQLAAPEVAREAFIRVVKDLRRAVDLLSSRPEIDASRLAYIGHSFGALVGGVLSGVEKRLQAFVLMAGTGSFIDIVALNMPFLDGPALEHYAQIIAPIDPIHYVGHAAPAALFFQFGRQDDFTRDQFERVAEAASEPKLVKWYDTDHQFQIAEAQEDRLDWLHQQLGKQPGI